MTEFRTALSDLTRKIMISICPAVLGSKPSGGSSDKKIAGKGLLLGCTGLKICVQKFPHPSFPMAKITLY